MEAKDKICTESNVRKSCRCHRIKVQEPARETKPLPYTLNNNLQDKDPELTWLVAAFPGKLTGPKLTIDIGVVHL